MNAHPPISQVGMLFRVSWVREDWGPRTAWKHRYFETSDSAENFAEKMRNPDPDFKPKHGKSAAELSPAIVVVSHASAVWQQVPEYAAVIQANARSRGSRTVEKLTTVDGPCGKAAALKRYAIEAEGKPPEEWSTLERNAVKALEDCGDWRRSQ